jgi:hypothetical protein
MPDTSADLVRIRPGATVSGFVVRGSFRRSAEMLHHTGARSPWRLDSVELSALPRRNHPTMIVQGHGPSTSIRICRSAGKTRRIQLIERALDFASTNNVLDALAQARCRVLRAFDWEGAAAIGTNQRVKEFG